MLRLTILKDDLPLLDFLKIPFSVIQPNDCITNMVDCELPSGRNVVAKLIDMRDHANNLSKLLQRA